MIFQIFLFGWMITLLCAINFPSNSFFVKQSKKLQRFMQLKTGKNYDQPCLWHHVGCLRNPANGLEMVGIQGVEIVKPIKGQALPSNGSEDLLNYQYLSKKLFIYVNPMNLTDPIYQFRLQRVSPFRKVNPVKKFQEHVRVSLDKSGNFKNIISWPGNRTLENTLLNIQDDTSSFRLFGSKSLTISHSVNLKKKKGLKNKWISFSGSGNSQKGMSSEFYTILDRSPLLYRYFLNWSTNNKWVSKYCPKITYQRFGEGPSWIIPGKACNIEINSHRYSSPRQLSKDIIDLVERIDPEFLHSDFDLTSFQKSADIFEKYKPWYSNFPFPLISNA